MKKFLPNPKSFIISFLIVNLFLFSTTEDFALTKTWAGGTGSGKNWTTAGNWSGGTAPVSGDDIVFNTAGTITFSTMPASVAYNSLDIMQGTVTLAAGANMTLTIGAVHPPDPNFEISGAATFTLGTNVNITLANNANALLSGDFYIGPGSIFNTNGTNVVTNVYGNLYNQGTVNSSLSTLTIDDGGAYRHNQNGGTIPTCTWTLNSFCILIGLVNTYPSGGNQPFGNFTCNSPTMTADITMASGASVANDFQVYNTGTARFILAPGSLIVGRDLVVLATLVISNTANTTLSIGRDASISGPAALDLCSAGAGNIGTLNVAGNFTNFGVITETGAGKGVINFNGSTVQSFNESGTLVNTIDLGINNTGGSTGVTFPNSLTINGALTLTNGILTIPTNTTLTIANGNPIGGSGFGAGKHINTQVSGATQGFVRVDNMAASTAYTLPTGNGTSYLPVTLTPSTISSFSVSVFTGITENGLPNGVAFTATKKQGVVNAVWTVNRNSGTLGVNMTTGWPTALEGSSFTNYTSPQIGIAHWDNPNWGTASGTGDNTANTATRTGVTVFSPFGVGKTPYVLPIKFSYLNAAKGNGYNTLNWKAVCSSSEVAFDIERSADGRNFIVINSINASQAQCAQPFDYADNNNLSGTVFYRIKSTEITGLVTYSTIVKLTDQQKDMQLIAVLPNPVINQAQLSINTVKKDMVDLVIISMEGKVMQRNSVQLQAGSSIINLDVANLQKGVYIIRGAFSNGQTSTIRFTKQ